MNNRDVSTPGGIMSTTTTDTTQLNTPTTPLPPPSPTVTTTDGITPLEGHMHPPPQTFYNPNTMPFSPPPSYDECLNMNVPPPSYDSLFGRVREVQRTSSNVADFVKNIVILFLGTIGCTVMIGVTIVIPVFMIIVGSLKINECPAEPFIPIYLVVGGTFGVVKVLLSLQGPINRQLRDEENGSGDNQIPWHRRLQFSGSINFFLAVWFILGCVWVYRIYRPSYDHSSWKYCDFSLYQFAFWLVTSVYIALGLLVSCMCGLSVTAVLMSHSRPRSTGDQLIRAKMASKVVRSTVRQVKPILSVDQGEARKRVLNLYKAWYRQIPYIVMDYDLPKSTNDCRQKLRELFENNRNVKDIRIIDMLVIKGQMELKETVEIWKQKHGLMALWQDTVEPRPKDFLSKFLDGHE
ncbi:hypothetical protein Pmani_000243 [Petrolisthes manimaculis]|uniref:Complex 1 LYR protein domain-containing protein n=1 Tax=Petrolisthes manimaculis TaxID=1843537 RepID=A0AAE1UMI8_9EUCA|nr:hypothetical protein Pmani_000243 [Petrolisthes manimaculis]